MTTEEIKTKLEIALRRLHDSQPDLFAFTPDTNQTEWNLTHHLASEIHRAFPDHHCDVDVAKPNFHNRRPDIIVHWRGTHESNLLVIELKRAQKDAPEEIEKIKNFWFQSPLNYQYGAVIVVNDENSKVVVIQNED